MGIPSYYFRNMLLQYDRQLVTARRLARLKPGPETDAILDGSPQSETATSPARGGSDLSLPLSVEDRRRRMVEHVARELLDNLLFTGSANPVVQEVREELDRALGGRYTFWYPPGEVDVRIALETPEGQRELTSEERKNVLAALWDITLAKVDATML